MKSRNQRVRSAINMNDYVKLGNLRETGMNSRDSWRHISNIVRTWKGADRSKANLLPNLFVTSLPDLQMDGCHLSFDPRERKKEANRLIWFTPHTCSTSTVFGLTLVCFCCKAACFFQFDLISTSKTLSDNWHYKLDPMRTERKRRAHLQVMQGVVWVGGGFECEL